jgi:hypothetical protein
MGGGGGARNFRGEQDAERRADRQKRIQQVETEPQERDQMYSAYEAMRRRNRALMLPENENDNPNVATNRTFTGATSRIGSGNKLGR